MVKPFGRLRRFLRELKRRKVYRVAAGYLVAGFVVLQLAGLAADAFGFPGWFQPMVWVMAGLGFPLAVVLAWAFEVTPEGVRRTPEAERAEEADAAEAGARTGYKLLLGLGLVAAAVAGGWYLIGGGGGKSPKVTDGTVAVLPFEISGSAREELRDGMVSLLSTGLDGAAGLRAIPDQTVLATWERTRSNTTGATVKEALAAARRIGARYGVVGTVTGVGSELQLSATAYQTTSGNQIGQIELSGAADSVTVLAGELTRRMLGVLASEMGEGLEAANLASVTTRSDTALRAFLAGERANRAGEYDRAIKHYQAAVRSDSGFALPYARLGLFGLWHPDFRGQYMRRAYRLTAQLPPRQRELVRALYLGRIERRTLAAADSLRRLTESYPDDPMVWFALGDLIYNTNIPAGLSEVEDVHRRAVELDPGYDPFHDHYVEAAFVLHHDSAVVADRVEAVPNEDWRRLYRLGQTLVFGDSARRQQALTAYDTVSIPRPYPLLAPLWAPQDIGLPETVIRRVLEREDVGPRSAYRYYLVFGAFQAGQIKEAFAGFRRWEIPTDARVCLLARGRTLGYPVPDSVTASVLEPKSLPAEPSPARLACVGLYLVDSGRGDELHDLVDRLRASVDTGGRDSISIGRLNAVVQELRGYKAWKQGNLDRAAGLWDRSNESGHAGAIWRGDLYRQRDQFDTAQGWYLAAWHDPVAHERLGRLYEEMDRPGKAAAAYRRFIAAWENADPELQPRIEAARNRLEELTGSQSSTHD